MWCPMPTKGTLIQFCMHRAVISHDIFAKGSPALVKSAKKVLVGVGDIVFHYFALTETILFLSFGGSRSSL